MTARERQQIDAVIAGLHDLAGRLSGTTMGRRLPPEDHGTASYLAVYYVDDDGVEQDLGDQLLAWAGQLTRLGLPRVKARADEKENAELLKSVSSVDAVARPDGTATDGPRA